MKLLLGLATLLNFSVGSLVTSNPALGTLTEEKASTSFISNEFLSKQRIVVYSFTDSCEFDYPQHPGTDNELMTIYCEAYVSEGIESGSGSSFISYDNPVATARFVLEEVNNIWVAQPTGNHPGIALTEYGERNVWEHTGEGIIGETNPREASMDGLKYREAVFELLLTSVFGAAEQATQDYICLITRPEDRISGRALHNLTNQLVNMNGAVIADEMSPHRGGIAFGYCPQYFNYR